MTKPVTIPNTFATATTAIPLSNLDADFSTVATAMNDANTYSNYAPDTGSANAYVVTLTGVSTTYSAGLRIQFKAGNANTTASTLNVNAQGAKNITYQDASALASGTIAANSIVDVMYDGTQFLLMNDPAGATGGDVTGPASATDNAVVRFDGTTGKLVQNSVVTIADSTGDISGVGQLNATTVDATNIEVTNIKAKDGTAAASIADSTGVVSITANPVLSGGTANGVLYLNGSKVATSGAALTFDGTSFSTTTLSLTNNAPFFTGANINAGANALGIGGGLIGFFTGGSEQMRLTSTGLGIGTSSPAQKLDVVGTIKATNATVSGSYSATGGGLQFQGSGATTGNIYSQQANSTTRLLWGVEDSAGGTLFTGSSAYVGVLGVNSAYSLQFATNNTVRATLDSSGNLGLGVTPSAWNAGHRAMQIAYSGAIHGNTSGNNLFVNSNAYFDSVGAFRYIQTGFASSYEQNSGQHRWYTAPSGTAGNAITFSQALTLDASGNLLLNGTSAPASSVGNLVMFNGTAPTGNVTNGCTLFCEDVSSSSELKVRDEAGNVTTLSPHNFSLIPEGPSEDMAWSYYSERDGRRINIDMLKAIRLLEKISGEQLVYEA